MSHFKLVQSTLASDVIPVKKYLSDKTGLTVIIAEVEGPLVNGFFCLATEAHDDDGLPHTLEHLIFLGSKRYPYKGLLDLLANRCMAHGTNAWTDTDHTCYTIDTAGDAGMLTLLPIYLDHILNPTLTDEGFITEVHHIDGEGQDAGVVYCEMQGRENSADSRCELKLLRAAYPNSGYSSETGGIMKNLRTSTNNEKVRDFHKKFYRPENLTVILTGQIEAQDVFRALTVVEDDIVEKRLEHPAEAWSRPWQAPPPPPRCGELRESWPADTEDCGQVLFGWRGPSLRSPAGLRELSSCALLLRYLCDTPAAPLQRALVEREDALAGDVSYNLTENLSALVKIELDTVPIDKLEAARDEARACLARVRSGLEPIDMDRMERLVRKQLREDLAALESDPHHALAFRCIGDALYSNNDMDFQNRMNPQRELRRLLVEPAAYWLALLNKYFGDECVTVVGAPSIQLQDSMASAEEARVAAQRSRLGAAGLALKGKQLQDAMDYNERPPPAGSLAGVAVPAADGLRCHALRTWSSGDACPRFDLAAVPMYARVHSLTTNFVYINLILDTSDADEATRRWLPLHLNGLAECPVLRGGVLVPHEQVVSDTERLTVLLAGGAGVGKPQNFAVGQYGNFVRVETRCEPADYERVVQLLHEVLRRARYTRERLLVFAQRLANDAAQVRRNGNKMVYDAVRDALYQKDSNVHWGTVLRQQAFLKDLIEKLNADDASTDTADADQDSGSDQTSESVPSETAKKVPSGAVENILEEARTTFNNLTRKIWLHLATDFDRFELSAEPWRVFETDADNETEPRKVEPPQLYSDSSLMTASPAPSFVAGCGGVESNFLVQLSPGPSGSSPAAAAPLLVALLYFTQLEGPMWRLIRGCGLSYGFGARSAPGEARLVFSLYRAAKVVAAYCKAKSIVQDYLTSGSFDSDLFDSAKSAAIFEVVEREKCPADVVSQSLVNYLKQVPSDYNSSFVRALSAVSPELMRAAAARWLPALFDASRATLGVVCHPGKVAEIQAAFEKIGIKLEAYESMEASHFNK